MGGGRLLSTSLVLEVNLEIVAEKWWTLRKTAKLDRLEVLEMVRDTVPNTAIDLEDG